MKKTGVDLFNSEIPPEMERLEWSCLEADMQGFRKLGYLVKAGGKCIQKQCSVISGIDSTAALREGRKIRSLLGRGLLKGGSAGWHAARHVRLVWVTATCHTMQPPWAICILQNS